MSKARSQGPAFHGELRVATFYVCDQLMGVEISHVQEINRLVHANPVPHAPPSVRGVINLRGEVVTVLDLRVVLGLPPTGLGRDCRCVVLGAGGDKTGLLVDRVSEVATVRAADIESPPANVRGVDGRFMLGVAKLERELLVILDPDVVLGEQSADETRNPAAAAV